MSTAPGKLEWLADGGEMAALIASRDWSLTPLGPIEAWPQSLRTTVSLCLASNFPINIIWGEGHTQIYNAGYRVACGAAHPRALGENYRISWASAWPAIGGPFERALAGETSFLENQRMFLERNGYPEETFFTFSLSPIRDERGQVAGLFHPVTETTATMLAQRRTRALRDIADRAGRASVFDEACSLLLETLGEYTFDLPFVLLYVVTPEGTHARLRGARGTPPGGPLAPTLIELGRSESGSWPLRSATLGGRVMAVTDMATRFGPVAAEVYPEPISTSFVLPIRVAGVDAPLGFLVIGASPRLPLDDDYRTFVELLGAAANSALGNARAYEEERLRAEALAELDRAKTAFFSNVSHEFRTPLTLMLGPLENALASPEHSLRGEELERVHRNGLRLLKLVNTLLDFSRLTSGRTRARFVPVNLAALTASLTSAFDSVMTAAGLRLVVDCPPLPEPVWVDTDLWEKIVLNLLSNAFKYTFAGTITVRLHERREQVELSVEDTGTGIAREQQPLIFERFHRVEGARGRTHEGSGIGLALVRELVTLHGGDVSVESEEGQGSTFRVVLPTRRAQVSDGPLVSSGPEPVSTSGSAQAFVLEARQWLSRSTNSQEELLTALKVEATRGHVLLADDNADMRDYLTQLLRSRFSVEAVADGQAALAAARARPPDVVLSDVMMPGMDGFGLVRALQAEPSTAHVPIMLVSARAGEDATVLGLEAGVEDYLVKPFGSQELLARVDAVIKAGRARAECRRLLREVETAHVRLSNLIEHAPAFVATLRASNHVFEMVNPLYQRLVGVGRKLLGLTVQQALPEVVQQGFLRLLDGVYHSGIPFTGREVPLQLDRSGSGQLEEVFVNFVYQPRRDVHGQVEGIDVFGFEVTEQVRARRRAEALAQRLRESEARQRQVVEASGMGLWDLDGGTGHLAVNGRTVEIMGLPPGTSFDLVPSLDYVHPEDRQLVARAVSAALEGRNQGQYFMVFRTGGRDDMPERWVESRAQRLISADGQRTTLAGALLDITERKATEALRARQTRRYALNALVGQVITRGTTVRDTLQDCVGVLVEQLKVARVRVWLLVPAHQELELEASDGLDTHLESPQARVSLGVGEVGRIAQEGRPSLTNRLQTDPQVGDPEGVRRERLVAFAGYPMRVRDQLVGVLGVYAQEALPEDSLDLLHPVADSLALGVERLRNEKALHTRVEFEQQLVGIVSHDLRNPLSAIVMGTSLLAQREGLNPHAAKSLGRIQSAAERATRMVKDLLDFTQARLGGGLKIARRPGDLNVVVRGVVEEVGVVYPSRDVELRQEGDGWGKWDVDRMAQVLQNLITNALKYSPQDSPVQVVTRTVDKGVLLSVANRGPPIPADKLTSIFEPMQRATAETDQVGRSVGLGLYIVKSIVAAHGGHITVTSTEAQGTVFTVSMPRQ